MTVHQRSVRGLWRVCVWVAPVAAAVLAFDAGAGLRAQQGQPRFRSGTDTVPVYVDVRDPDRGFLTDLTADDFELRDEGKLQKITQFTLDEQPLSVMILIDGSGSMLSEFNRALEGANSVILRMNPGDRARIGSFAHKVAFSPEFTSNRDELLAYLKDEFHLIVGDQTHLWEALYQSVELLTDERGKRVIIVMSDGYNFVLPPGFRNAQPPGTPIGRGPNAPPIAGGPGGGKIGLGGRNPTGGTTPTGPTGSTIGADPGNPERNGVPLEDVRMMALGTDTTIFGVSMWVRDGTSSVRPHRDLERLALETGGGAYASAVYSDMYAPFGEIMQQLRQQYLLGFVPTVLDGKKHSLSVKVKRPRVEVRARTSYVAAGGK